MRFRVDVAEGRGPFGRVGVGWGTERRAYQGRLEGGLAGYEPAGHHGGGGRDSFRSGWIEL